MEIVINIVSNLRKGSLDATWANINESENLTKQQKEYAFKSLIFIKMAEELYGIEFKTQDAVGSYIDPGGKWYNN